jgi:chemotaxis protein methyltransferase CheR
MAATTDSPSPATQPQLALSAEGFRFLREYVYRGSGVVLGEDKLYLIQSRLLPVVEAEGLRDIEALAQTLRGNPAAALRRRVLEAMVTHETLFFRDPAVYEALRTSILPELIQARQATRTLRIWSAACSSGQEAYSLAMMLLELGLRDWNLQIVGTDLSLQILDRARAGRYLQIEVNRGLPATLLVKYFQREGLDWQLRDEVRRLVRFTPLDLRETPYAIGPFDLALCRNVLIYFDVPTRKSILGAIRRTMQPGGYLLLGASETTFNIDDSYQRKTVGNCIVYQTPA